jgi:hypothetical protein
LRELLAASARVQGGESLMKQLRGYRTSVTEWLIQQSNLTNYEIKTLMERAYSDPGGRFESEDKHVTVRFEDGMWTAEVT